MPIEFEITKSPSTFITILIFMFFVPFNAEVLTGSNPIELFVTNPIVALIGLILYGLQVAILADIAARYRLSNRAIFLLGFVFTLVQEDLGSGTFENTKLVYTTLLLRIGEFNVSYAFFILAFQSIITVWTSIAIIRLAWPTRVSQPFLYKRHYVVIVPVLIVTYGGLIYYNLSTSVFPPIGVFAWQIVIVLALLVVVLYAIRQTVNHTPPKAHEAPVRWYSGLALVSAFLFGALAMIVGAVDTFDYAVDPKKSFPVLTPLGIAAQIVAIGISILSLLLAWKLFTRLDTDPALTNAKLYAVVVTFLLFWLVLGFIFRTLISDVFVLLVFPGEFYLIRRASTPTLTSHKPPAESLVDFDD